MPENDGGHRRLAPDTTAYSSYPPLMKLNHCWEEARGRKMLPNKFDFEGSLSKRPEILPELTIVERTAGGDFRYIYVGNRRFRTRGIDQTRELFQEAFAPSIHASMSMWTETTFDTPHIVFFKVKTRLDDGDEIESINLSTVLSNNDEVPTYLVTLEVMKEAERKKLTGSGALIGSAGVDRVSIDIGFGVPDVPSSV